MGEVILVFAVIAIMIGGFFVMKRLDAFLEENRKAIEKEQEEQCRSYRNEQILQVLQEAHAS